VPSLVFNLSDDLFHEQLAAILFYQDSLADLEAHQSMYASLRSQNLQTPKKLIEEIMSTSTTPQTPSAHLTEPASQFFQDKSLHGLTSSMTPRLTHPASSRMHSERLAHTTAYLVRTNRHHCNFAKPVYGRDLQELVGFEECFMRPLKTTYFSNYQGASHATCAQTVEYRKNRHKGSCYWTQSEALADMLNVVRDGLYDSRKNYEMLDVLSRFIVYVPGVVTPVVGGVDVCGGGGSVRLCVSHPRPCVVQRQKWLGEEVMARRSGVREVECVLKEQLVK
jgi:hypothetical protein